MGCSLRSFLATVRVVAPLGEVGRRQGLLSLAELHQPDFLSLDGPRQPATFAAIVVLCPTVDFCYQHQRHNHHHTTSPATTPAATKPAIIAQSPFGKRQEPAVAGLQAEGSDPEPVGAAGG